MPTGKEPGLDGRHWQDLDPHTAIAQRRDSTTGIEARSYSQVTAPKIESTTKETKPDIGVLTHLQLPDESKQDYLSRLSSFVPIGKTGKIMEPEDKAVGMADEGKACYFIFIIIYDDGTLYLYDDGIFTLHF